MVIEEVDAYEKKWVPTGAVKLTIPSAFAHWRGTEFK